MFYSEPYAQPRKRSCGPQLARSDRPQRIQEDNEAYQRRYIRYDTRPATNDLQERLAQMQPITAYTWDDKGMGELFADMYRDYCRYNVTAKEWYVYDGVIWKADTGAMQVSQRAKELANALLVYCTTIEDERQKANYLKKVSNYGQ